MTFLPWVLRFTTSTEADRTTRLDLNESGVIEVAPDIDLGEAAQSLTLADVEGRDGEVVTQRKRPNREIRVPLRIYGDSLAWSQAMGKIARECDRDYNLLEWWPKGEGAIAAEPVFFVVLAGDVSPPVFEEAGAGFWTCELTLACEPAALGSRVSGSATVSNDPAAASNPQGLTLPAIAGHLPAPLDVTIARPPLGAAATVMLSSHARTGTSARIIQQAETSTLNTDTTLQTNDAAMSGSNYARCSFATDATVVTRFNFQASLFQGTYRLWLRLRKTAAADEFDLSYSRPDLPNNSSGDTVHYPATTSTGPHWLNLGEIAYPPSSAIDPAVTITDTFYIQAGRTAGAGSLDFDCVVLLPLELVGSPPPQTSHVWRGQAADLVYDAGRGEFGSVYMFPSTPPRPLPNGADIAPVGTLPMVHPDLDNHLSVMLSVGLTPGPDGSIPSDPLTNTAVITWSYNPRYLFVSS